MSVAQIEGRATAEPRSPSRRLADAALDRLFTPHGPEAYFRFLRPSAPAPAARAGAAAGRPTPAADRVGSPDHDRPSATVLPPATPAPPARRRRPGATEEQPVAIVRFARSAVEAAPEGSLLETAEAAGLTPRNRCRRGICGTCTTPKVSGTTRDLRTGETSSEPGPIRICVSVACDPVTLDL